MRLSELDIPKQQLIDLVESYIYNARNKAIFLKKIEGYTYEELREMMMDAPNEEIRREYEKIINRMESNM